METIEPPGPVPGPPPAPVPGPPPAPVQALVTWPEAPALPALRPGQLSPGWRMAFISGWIGVLAGYGALWQAGRLAGIAPWWLGPQTDLQPVFVIAVPYIAPLVAIVCAFVGVRASCYVGVVASLACGAIALGDLHFPGLAVVDGLIAVFALMISVACLGGRMRALPAGSDTDHLVHDGPPAPMGIAEQL